MVEVVSTQPRPRLVSSGADPTPVAIAGLGTALPRHRVDGSELLATLSEVWPPLRRRIRGFAAELANGSRYLVRPPSDFAHSVPLEHQRSRYLDEATRLGEVAARQALAMSDLSPGDIGLLVVASCTGFVLPGVDVRLVERLGLQPDVRRLPLAHFGCAGGAAALSHAAEWVRGAAGRRSLVVAVETPSLTFRPADTSADNLVSALVFGDGAAAAVLCADRNDDRSLHIGRTSSSLVSCTHDALGFEVVSDGFRVIVSRRLPALLCSHLPGLVNAFLTAPASQLDAVALHPGGRAIVDAVAACLDLRAPQLSATRRTLERTGNTSSAALLFVLAELADQLPSPAGGGLALAFGPGLTVEMLELGWGC